VKGGLVKREQAGDEISQVDELAAEPQTAALGLRHVERGGDERRQPTLTPGGESRLIVWSITSLARIDLLWRHREGSFLDIPDRE